MLACYWFTLTHSISVHARWKRVPTACKASLCVRRMCDDTIDQRNLA
jgi:hypothetical protein